MNAIVILVRGEQSDIEDLNLCIKSLKEHLFFTLLEADVLIFHEAGFDSYKKMIKIPQDFPSMVKFIEISLSVPVSQLRDFGREINDFYPHPTHGNGPIGFGHPGFSIGYRSMCRFFSAILFKHEIFQSNQYKYILRLDSDSLFLKGQNFSLFKWAENLDLKYSFIASAIQQDHKRVIKFFKFNALKYFIKKNIWFFIKSLFIPRGRIFYTNFEICKVSFFCSNKWQNYFEYLDKTGGFYLFRWGDALVRYMGVRVLIPRKFRKPIPSGFVYKHGGIFYSYEKPTYKPRFLQRF